MDARRLQDVVNEFYSKGLITKASQRARIIWSMTNNKQVSTLCQNITTYLEKIDGKNDTKLALDAILFLFKEINKFKQNEQNSSAQKNINDLTLILTTDLNMDPKNDNTWEEAQAKLAIQNPLSSTASTVTIATSGLKTNTVKPSTTSTNSVNTSSSPVTNSSTSANPVVTKSPNKAPARKRILGMQMIEDENGKKKLRINLKKSFQTVVYEGGGAKGMVYPGALAALYELDMLNDVECYGGSSAGAITAFVSALGYQGKELIDRIDNVDVNTLLDRQILAAGGKLGTLKTMLFTGSKKRNDAEGENFINTGNNLLMTARNMIRERFIECYKNASPEIKSRMDKYGIKAHIDRNRITFLDLKYMQYLFPEKNFRELLVTATAMCGHSKSIAGQEFFNVDNYPNAEPALGIRKSASLPHVFKRPRYLGRYYMDGGVTQNLPLQYFVERYQDYPGDILALQFTRPQKKLKDTPDTKKRMVDLVTGTVDANDWHAYSKKAVETKKIAAEQGTVTATVSQGDIDTLDFDAKTNTKKFPSGYVDKMRDETKANLINKLQAKPNQTQSTPEQKNPTATTPPLIDDDANEIEHSIVDENAEDTLQAKNNEKNQVVVNPELINQIDKDEVEVEYYIDGEKVTLPFHQAKLKIQVVRELQVQSNQEKELSPLEKADALYEETKHRNDQFFSLLEQYQHNKKGFNDKNGVKTYHLSDSNPFQDLYKTIDFMSSDQGQLDENTKKWLSKIVQYASPMDIILNTGIVGASLTMLLRQNKLDIYKKRINILNNILEQTAEQFKFNNSFHLRDTAGEFEKLNHQKDHQLVFKKIGLNIQPDINKRTSTDEEILENNDLLYNKNYLQAVQSPHVINDILNLDRIQDIKGIGYGESISKVDERSKYANNFLEEIKNGDPRWITDLFICVELYRKFYSDPALQLKFASYADPNNPWHKNPYAAYIEHVYRYGLGMDTSLDNMDSNAANRPSWVVKLFINRKLNNPDPKQGDFSGNTALILCDLADEVKYYFKGLGYDIQNQAIEQISEITFVTNETAPTTTRHDADNIKIQKWKNDFNKLRQNRQGCLSRAGLKHDGTPNTILHIKFQPLKAESFDPSITNKGKGVLTDLNLVQSKRSKNLNELCKYINKNPLTWYEDLMGVNSKFAIKENPLMKLIMSSHLTEDTCLLLMARLEKHHHHQEQEKFRWKLQNEAAVNNDENHATSADNVKLDDDVNYDIDGEGNKTDNDEGNQPLLDVETNTSSLTSQSNTSTSQMHPVNIQLNNFIKTDLTTDQSLQLSLNLIRLVIENSYDPSLARKVAENNIIVNSITLEVNFADIGTHQNQADKASTSSLNSLSSLLTNVKQKINTTELTNDQAIMLDAAITSSNKEDRQNLNNAANTFNNIILSRLLFALPNNNLNRHIGKAHNIGFRCNRLMSKIVRESNAAQLADKSEKKNNSAQEKDQLDQIRLLIITSLAEISDKKNVINAFTKSLGIQALMTCQSKQDILTKTNEIIDQFSQHCSELIKLSEKAEYYQSFSKLFNEDVSSDLFEYTINPLFAKATNTDIKLDNLAKLNSQFSKKLPALQQELTTIDQQLKNNNPLMAYSDILVKLYHYDKAAEDANQSGGNCLSDDYIKIFYNLVAIKEDIAQKVPSPNDSSKKDDDSLLLNDDDNVPNSPLNNFKSQIIKVIENYIKKTMTNTNLNKKDRAASKKRIDDINGIIGILQDDSQNDLVTSLESELHKRIGCSFVRFFDTSELHINIQKVLNNHRNLVPVRSANLISNT